MTHKTMTHNPMTVFNREILNCLSIAVRQNGGEIHGSWPVIAALLAHELGLGDEDTGDRMQRHLIAVGLQYLTEQSDVAFFRGMTGDLHLVERRLCDE